MLAVISPAKSLDFESRPHTRKRSMPDFLTHSAELIDGLRELAPGEVSDLMNISTRLGELNCNRYHEWRPDNRGAKQAALAFRGDVYMGLAAWDMEARELTSLQRRVRILSGLYGLLKPLDLIHPYRLEMGTKFENARGRNLYEFWGSAITDALNEELGGHRVKVLVNLASNEYWGAVRPAELEAKVISTRFLERTDGRDRMISFFAKRARGLMAAHIARNRVETLRGLKEFSAEGYAFDAHQSSAEEFVYVREGKENAA